MAQDEKQSEQQQEQQQQQPAAKSEQSKKEGPPGGYDATPIPRRPPGYTIKFTINRATRLPLADLASLSSDPYCKLELKTGLPSRHKEDPPLVFRTRTIWRNTEPEWNQEWIVANVPSSGAKLKVRIYDEDSSDKDDRLGNAHITINGIGDEWKGFQNKEYKIMKRAGSWRAYALRGLAVCMRRTQHMNGILVVSAENLGRSPDEEGGRAYTVGLQYWCKNYSPILGRLAGSKEPDDPAYHNKHAQDHDQLTGENTQAASKASMQNGNGDKKEKNSQRYNFQSNQMQLQGPVPPELYHRYVEFKPIIKGLFTGSGLRGIILNKALHTQHNKVYNFNQQTKYGVFEEPCTDMTLKFLDLAHWDQGGRIHTYVLTLDGLLRFTETGKEISIDLLSKHTMHSDASIYVAYSGEFFIRRLKQRHNETPEHGAAEDATATHEASHPPEPLPGGPPQEDPPKDPRYYELIIDNDSGTYRPNAKLLPLLRDFLHKNFPGLKVVTLDSQGDAELMNKLKDEQRQRKKREGDGMVFAQVSRSSSLSSDDEARLDTVAQTQNDNMPNKPKHQLGEAIGPYLEGHEHARKAFVR